MNNNKQIEIMTTKTATFYKTTKENLIKEIELSIANNKDNNFNYLYTLALSMIKNNNERNICPFNDLYFSLTEKQESFINAMKNKYQYPNNGVVYLFLSNGLKAQLSFYNPTTNKKTYITFLITKQ